MRLMKVGLLALLVTLASLPMPAAAGEPKHSARLDELKSRYLEDGDVGGFWSEVRKISDAGDYPFVEEIVGSSEAPADYVRVTFLQDYRSKSLSDLGRKELLLRRW